MNDEIKKEFECTEKRHFKFKIGNILASGLSGFIAGIIFSAIFFVALFILYLRFYQ